MYATLYYAYHKITVLLEKYALNLLYFKRYIDDILGIWFPYPDSHHTRDDFLGNMNDFGQLRLTANIPSDNIIFLDLLISIDPKQTILTKTYQKK
jgi:hypothetical protein